MHVRIDVEQQTPLPSESVAPVHRNLEGGEEMWG